MRLFWIFLVLAVLVLTPFVIWGARFEEMFSPQAAVEWIRGYGRWAWAAGLILLVLDLFLPLPSTVVMSALGYVYGFFWGGILAGAGSFLAGSLAYGMCRLIGPRAARWIVGGKGLAEGERFIEGAGGWLVALSRCLPILPEVITCMAGLTRMRARPFFAALACGCLPTGLIFAAVGHAGIEHPALAVLLSVAVPLVLWAVVRPYYRRRRGHAAAAD